MALNKATSPWRVFLRDDDGQLLSPAEIQPIKRNRPIYLYLNQDFERVNRCAALFRVSFPKLEKSMTGQPFGDQPVQLILTGVPATVPLSWEDPALFYLPEEEKRKPS